MSLLLYSRPTDRSLQAFKDWIQNMTYPLNPKIERTIITKPWIDEAGWIDNWKKFWTKVDGASKSQRPGQG
jgi:hypothetical protein